MAVSPVGLDGGVQAPDDCRHTNLLYGEPELVLQPPLPLIYDVDKSLTVPVNVAGQLI